MLAVAGSMPAPQTEGFQFQMCTQDLKMAALLKLLWGTTLWKSEQVGLLSRQIKKNERDQL